MNAPTLEELRTELEKIAKRIDALAQQPDFPLTIAAPTPREGEKFVGIIISADGKIKKRLYLLPGDNDDANWKNQMAWAESIGGRLPDRVEGALLFATMKDEFKPEAYWTCEQHAASSDTAWCQTFNDGNQSSYDTSFKLRARAVRSETIE